MASPAPAALRATVAVFGAGALLCAGSGVATARDQTEGYLAANPAVRADIEAIRAPSRDVRDRCNLPQRALILADSL